MKSEFTLEELFEANEKCEKIIEMIISIPRDDETYDLLDKAFRLVWDAKQNIAMRLLLDCLQRGEPFPPAPPWERKMDYERGNRNGATT